MNVQQIRVGARCRFVPGVRQASNSVHSDLRSAYAVTGKIVYVNHAHRWFRVAYRAGKRGELLSECFKF